jgi:DNA topoisomerase IA
MTPEKAQQMLNRDQTILYTLIYQRTLASQIASAQ